MNIKIIENTSKDSARELTEFVEDFILLSNHTVAESVENADMLISLGGDGTMLRTWRDYGRHNIPIFGINCGHLGYLTEGTKVDWQDKLEQILNNNNYSIESRMTIGCNVKQYGFSALNEFSIMREGAGLFEYSVFVDGIHLMDCRADGVICATPTGSTAYALSAGGSFIDPTTRAIEIIPICPHSLLNRSIVFSNKSKITIKANSRGLLYSDGNRVGWAQIGDEFLITEGEYDMKLIVVEKESFIKRISKNFT